MKRKTKQTLKTILLGALGIGAIVGVASGVNALVEKNDEDLKVIHPVFEVGGLNEADGKYEKSDKTLYTKTAFECQGLEIKLDFDNTIKYQVFFYESDGDFISSTPVYDGNSELEVPLFATHARIELTPNWAEMGEDYDTEKEQIVKWYEAPKYASQIEVKVAKEQVFELDKNYAIVDKDMTGKYYSNNSGVLSTSENTEFTAFELIDVSASNVVKIYVPSSVADEHHMCLWLSEGQSVLGTFALANYTPEIKGGYHIYTFDVREEAGLIAVNANLAEANNYFIVLS